MAAALQPQYQKAYEWLDSGTCVVLDEETLLRLGEELKVDFTSDQIGEGKPKFDRNKMERFLAGFIWVDAKTRHQVEPRKMYECLMCKYLLVAPGLMTGRSFIADETTLRKSILAAKRVFVVPPSDKYKLSMSSPSLRFLDFNKEPGV